MGRETLRLVLGVVFSLSLAACTGGSGDAKSPTGSAPPSVSLSPTPMPSAVASPTEESSVIQCEDTGSGCAELLRAYLVAVVGLPRSSVPNNRSLDAIGLDECDVLSRAQALPDESFKTIVRKLLQGIEPNDYAREILGGIVDVYCLDMRPRIDESELGIPPYTPGPESNANEDPNQGSGNQGSGNSGGGSPRGLSVAYKLAVIDGDPSEEAAFQAAIDCIMASGIKGAETERKVGDTLVASWEQSGKQLTLLEWAQLLCSA